jgi:serine phosphatase RsbU (regulator of sigma subunit)
LGLGFFFISVPIASIISVMREIIPEKFYTIMRLGEHPLGSFHLGRMLLFGVSIGALYSAIVFLFPYTGEHYGIPSLAVLHLKSEYYTLPFMLRSPIASVANAIGLEMTVSFIVTTIPVMLAYWLLPRKYAVLFALFLTSLLWGLFEATQGLNVSAILAQAIIRGWIGFAVLYYGDMLALVAFIVVESFLVSVGTFASHPILLVCLGAMLFLVVVVGGIAYQKNAPEVVNEADYKPNFLSLLEENERMHQEIAAAKSVQQKLLPRSLPTFDSVVVSAACIPAYEVGGDYYDFFPLDDKRLGVLIGDVSGKGISAAFYITLAKGVIVSQVRNVGSPSDVLHRVNSLLYGVMERGKFVSMIYGIYNTHSREFSFSNAGHNPLVVRRVNGEIQTISAKGMAIGLDKGERFERAVTTASLTLEKGDCILLYTDGVTEAMNTDHAEYGEERMMQAVQAAPLNAADIVSAALADVRKFAGKAHQHDDITLVALQAV